MLDEQVTVIVADGATDIVPGALVIGLQVAPESVLISVKISKKLLRWKLFDPSCRTLVLPKDARVGLSRIITPGGKFPPAISRLVMSVSKSACRLRRARPNPNGC